MYNSVIYVDIDFKMNTTPMSEQLLISQNVPQERRFHNYFRLYSETCL